MKRHARREPLTGTYATGSDATPTRMMRLLARGLLDSFMLAQPLPYACGTTDAVSPSQHHHSGGRSVRGRCGMLFRMTDDIPIHHTSRTTESVCVTCFHVGKPR